MRSLIIIAVAFCVGTFAAELEVEIEIPVARQEPLIAKISEALDRLSRQPEHVSLVLLHIIRATRLEKNHEDFYTITAELGPKPEECTLKMLERKDDYQRLDIVCGHKHMHVIREPSAGRSKRATANTSAKKPVSVVETVELTEEIKTPTLIEEVKIEEIVEIVEPPKTSTLEELIAEHATGETEKKVNKGGKLDLEIPVKNKKSEKPTIQEETIVEEIKEIVKPDGETIVEETIVKETIEPTKDGKAEAIIEETIVRETIEETAQPTPTIETATIPGGLTTVSEKELMQLRIRIVEALERLHKEPKHVRLLLININSARSQVVNGRLFVIDAILGLPARRCTLRLLEEGKSFEKLNILCGKEMFEVVKGKRPEREILELEVVEVVKETPQGEKVVEEVELIERVEKL